MLVKIKDCVLDLTKINFVSPIQINLRKDLNNSDIPGNYAFVINFGYSSVKIESNFTDSNSLSLLEVLRESFIETWHNYHKGIYDLILTEIKLPNTQHEKSFDIKLKIDKQ